MGNAGQALIDDGVENVSESHAMDTSGGNEELNAEQDEIHIEQICLANDGEAARPDHIFRYVSQVIRCEPADVFLQVLYSSDMLVVYAVQTRTDSASDGRRSLPVRFRKTATEIPGQTRVLRSIRPITLGDQQLMCLTDTDPHDIYEDGLGSLVCFNWSGYRRWVKMYASLFTRHS